MGLKKTLKSVMGLPNTLYNKVVFAYRHVKHGNNLKINGRIFCVSNSKDGIILGDNVSINSSRSSNPIGGDAKTILFAKGNGKIYVSDRKIYFECVWSIWRIKKSRVGIILTLLFGYEEMRAYFFGEIPTIFVKVL